MDGELRMRVKGEGYREEGDEGAWGGIVQKVRVREEERGEGSQGGQGEGLGD